MTSRDIPTLDIYGISHLTYLQKDGPLTFVPPGETAESSRGRKNGEVAAYLLIFSIRDVWHIIWNAINFYDGITPLRCGLLDG